MRWSRVGSVPWACTAEDESRTKCGVAPAQTKVLGRGHFAELISAACSSTVPYGVGWMNGMAIFTGEHCACSCVHPSPAKTELLNFVERIMQAHSELLDRGHAAFVRP